jgi:hypothetical protein
MDWSEFVKLFIQGFVAGFTFLIGQYFLKFVIEPIKYQKEEIGDLSEYLNNKFNQYFLSINNGSFEEKQLLQSELRAHISKLFKSYNTIPCYKFFSKIGLIIKKENLLLGIKSLNFITSAPFELNSEMNSKLNFTIKDYYDNFEIAKKNLKIVLIDDLESINSKDA